MLIERLRTYVPYAWHFAALRSAGPFICGIAITDHCNLSCRGCHVSNTGMGDMPFADVVARLKSAYARGCREAYFTGGEPMLWRDGDLTVEDLIVEARAHRLLPRARLHERHARAGQLGGPHVGEHGRAAQRLRDPPRRPLRRRRAQHQGPRPPQDRGHLRHRPLHAGRRRAVPALGALVAACR